MVVSPLPPEYRHGTTLDDHQKQGEDYHQTPPKENSEEGTKYGVLLNIVVAFGGETKMRFIYVHFLIFLLTLVTLKSNGQTLEEEYQRFKLNAARDIYDYLCKEGYDRSAPGWYSCMECCQGMHPIDLAHEPHSLTRRLLNFRDPDTSDGEPGGTDFGGWKRLGMALNNKTRHRTCNSDEYATVYKNLFVDLAGRLNPKMATDEGMQDFDYTKVSCFESCQNEPMAKKHCTPFTIGLTAPKDDEALTYYRLYREYGSTDKVNEALRPKCTKDALVPLMNNKQDNPLPTMLFLPCGIDDLRERDVAEFLDPLPGLALAAKEEEKKVDDDDVKEEQETIATLYQDAPATLNTLKARLAGEAPWLEGSIPHPLVTLQTPYSPRNVYFDYEPKIFYYSERAYEDWLEMDSSQHLFHWRQETSENCSEASPYSYTQTWYCHCAGKPEIKKKTEDRKRRQVFKSSKHMVCLARVYVHKFKDGHPPAPGYPPANASKRVRLIYYGRHTGHVLGDLEGFQHLRIRK
ncbi:hypothetical protein BKA57DRAFT_494054 [Linnemannia elongata]|nr:hypothetical protein BKA57DRAFT_494054 [Linnemannia elongata]